MSSSSLSLAIGSSTVARLAKDAETIERLTLSMGRVVAPPTALLKQTVGALGAVAALPKLSSLILSSICCRIPASKLAMVLDATKGSLTKLTLKDVTLSGDWEELCTALQHHPKLDGITIAGLRGGGGNNVVKFLSAIGTCHNLWKIDLDLRRCIALRQEPMDSPLQAICSLPQLSHLRLFLRRGLKSICQSLQNGQTIKKVDLDAKCTGQSVEALQAMKEMLQENNTIEKVCLWRPVPSVLSLIAEALRSNQTLKILRIWGYASVSKEAAQALAEALEHNHSLRWLEYNHMESNWDNDLIPFYTKLNRAGRQTLLQNMGDRKVWEDTICKHKNDTDVVFYFLSRNPGFFSPNAANPSKKKKKRKSKATTKSQSTKRRR